MAEVKTEPAEEDPLHCAIDLGTSDLGKLNTIFLPEHDQWNVIFKPKESTYDPLKATTGASKRSLRLRAVSFDNVHIATLITQALYKQRITIREFAHCICRVEPQKMLQLIQHPKDWEHHSAKEQSVYKRMSDWLHGTSHERMQKILDYRNETHVQEEEEDVTSFSSDLRGKPKTPYKEYPYNYKENQKTQTLSKLLRECKEELESLNVSYEKFSEKILDEQEGDKMLLYQEPKQYPFLSTEETEKLLKIQTWMCLPANDKLSALGIVS